ncbi:MAG: T9SS type A sorting domain-containing protein [Sphingobacteriales bacterium]|jgi:hypothetical protein|nr:T9SS type A sorting domain-containing protein [Sphingobacteriales bacterium]MBP9141391.1 T9SS type A sorting domain-containing protein [Chitinophagales bacterium]MDA0198107.1 T9SS type A sorting domain-containing protein [Bacteroidota bacterium]MBK6890154.1 T9SS type A sorting domain-containing protein [Sphingobacteriales bacterium]MBK7527320.1 T9SS type A sorting domain-containing protein [Sphingobacteriales bacterium]
MKYYFLLLLATTIYFTLSTIPVQAQEYVLPLTNNKIAYPSNVAEKGYRQNFSSLCQTPVFLSLQNITVPTCKLKDGALTLKITGAQGDFTYYINGQNQGTFAADTFKFTNLEATAYFFEVKDGTGKTHTLKYSLNNPDVTEITATGWRIKPAFCSTLGSIERISFDIQVKEYKVYDQQNKEIDIIKAGNKKVDLNSGWYYVRSTAQATGCVATWIFEIPRIKTNDLPFVEDFSGSLVYPDPTKWMDDFAYINQNYAWQPMGIGTATLDGLNNFGQPYSQGTIGQPLAEGYADKLTARPFCLTDVKNTTAADTVYMRFFYQPQGLGDRPEPGDSLMLELTYPIVKDTTIIDTIITPTTKFVWKDTLTTPPNTATLLVPTDSLHYIDLTLIWFEHPKNIVSWVDVTDPNLSFTDTLITTTAPKTIQVADTVWKKVWATDISELPETPLNEQFPFFQADLTIADAEYFYNGFSYRFRNKASLTGSNDHWNLDYIQLDIAPLLDVLRDVAPTQPLQTLLNNYTAMPWNQFIQHVNTQFADTLKPVLRNNINEEVGVIADFLLEDLCFDPPTITYTSGISLTNIPTQTTQTDKVNISKAKTDLANLANNPAFANRDSVVLQTTLSFIANNQGPGILQQNDTLFHYQPFFNYFAYDDGSAEQAYGLYGKGARLAYRFVLNNPDTLRAIQFGFVNHNANNNSNGFIPVVYKSIEQNSNNDQLLYPPKIEQPHDPQYVVYPKYFNATNGFWTYTLNQPILVSDTIYVGFYQIEKDLLNIGFDRNTNSQQHLFTNYNGFWEPSIQAGSLMIRPILDDEPLPNDVNVGITTPPSDIEQKPDIKTNLSGNLQVFPNPANKTIQVTALPNTNLAATITIYDFLGRKVWQTNNNTNIGQTTNIVNIEHFAPGLYIVQTYDVHGFPLANAKFIKQ